MMSYNRESIWGGLLPKQETQASRFVQDHPEWDGRGVVVGILDTGVDPGAFGLQKTSDGKQKVIDIIDCTGSGDVALSPPTACNEEQTLVGLTGRRIKINSSWINPSGMYRIGMKRAFELYPRGLQDRVKAERKKKHSESMKDCEKQLLKLLIETKDADMIDDIKLRCTQLKAAETCSIYEDLGPAYDCVVFHDGNHWQACVDTTETGDMSTASTMTDYRTFYQFSTFSEIDSLNFCVAILDEGSILSIVVDSGAHGTHVAGIVAAFHPDQLECNGVAPGAQIVSLKIGDTRLGSMETGVGLVRGLIEAVKRGCHIINMSFGEATAWDNYGEFIRLADKLVYDHGIIFVASAGNNGPAISTVGCPGGTTSSIISVAALATQSLMNVAYAYSQVMPETNYTWSSVGPTLDGDLGVSIIAPGGAVTCVPNWTLNKKQLMNGTSMSSPNACGCITLLLSACKAVGMPYTPVRVRHAIENSALRIEDVSVLGQGHGLIQVHSAFKLLELYNKSATCWADTPMDIKLNSERCNRGIYLRQYYETNNASTYLVNIDPLFRDSISPQFKTNFEVRIKLESSASWIRCNERIIFLASGKQITVFVDPTGLTEGLHTEFVRGYDESNIHLGPIFFIPVVIVKPELVSGTQYTLGQVNLSANERLRRFICPPLGTQYVDAVIKDTRLANINLANTDPNLSEPPTHENLSASGIGVRFHPSVLRDRDLPNPVPQDHGSVDDENTFSLINETGKATLAGTSIAESVIETSVTDISPSMIVIHAVQLFRGTPYRDNEKQSYVTLRPGSENCLSWAVTDGWTMEFTVARSWANIIDPACEITLYFRGIQPEPAQITFQGGSKVSPKVTVFSKLVTNPIEISPIAKLDKWQAMVKPITVGKVQPLGERDILPDGTPLYQLILEYEFEQSEAGELVPRWHGLQGVLYESDFHAQFFMLYDANKKLITCGDSWPSFKKLNKGKHVLRLQIRHASVSILDALVELPVILERKITAVALSFFKTQSEALVGSEKMSTRPLIKDGAVSMYIREPNHDQLPKGVSVGDLLVGQVTYMKKNDNFIGAGNKPGGYSIKYIVNDTKSSQKSTSNNGTTGTGKVPDAASNEPTLSGLETAVKEAKLKYLKSLSGKLGSTFDETFDLISIEYPDNLSILEYRLSHVLQLRSKLFDSVVVDNNKDIYKSLGSNSDQLSDIVKLDDRIVQAATNLLSLINEASVAMELGVNAPSKEDKSAAAARKDAESKKGLLVQAYNAKALVALDRLRLYGFIQPSAYSNSQSIPATIESNIEAAAEFQALGLSPIQPSESTRFDEFMAECNCLQKWDDLNADKNWIFFVEKMKRQGKWGAAIKRVHDLITALDSNKIKDLDAKSFLHGEWLICLEKLGWMELTTEAKRMVNLSASAVYNPF